MKQRGFDYNESLPYSLPGFDAYPYPPAGLPAPYAHQRPHEAAQGQNAAALGGTDYDK